MSDKWTAGLSIDLNKDGNVRLVKGSDFKPEEIFEIFENMIRVAEEEKCLVDTKIQGTECPNTRKYKRKRDGVTIDLALGFDPETVAKAMDDIPAGTEAAVYVSYVTNFPSPVAWIPTLKRAKKKSGSGKKKGYQFSRK